MVAQDGSTKQVPLPMVYNQSSEGIWDFEAAAGYNQKQEDEIAKKDKIIK
jgi:hypothetical protein